MKLRWYDRILVALSGLVLIAVGVCVILAAGGVITLPDAIAFDTWLGDGWQWMPLVFLAGVLIIIWGLWLLIRPFQRGDRNGKYYVLKDEADGDVKISVQAIDHLVHKCINAYDQIVSAKVKIGGKEDAMEITLHVVVRTDVRIPSLIEELREDIKKSLQHSAGVTVSGVQVYVDATRDDKDKDEVRYLEAETKAAKDAPVEDFINTTNFYTAPVVVTADTKPAPEAIPEDEPKVAELKQEIDLGPDEPLPVDLSAQAFPFPEEEAGVPLEIFTGDVPIKDDAEEENR